MGKYLKMADVFKRQVSVVEVSFLTLDHHNRTCDEYAAHAINSHDELVEEAERLRCMIDGLEREYENIIEMLLEKISAVGSCV